MNSSSAIASASSSSKVKSGEPEGVSGCSAFSTPSFTLVVSSCSPSFIAKLLFYGAVGSSFVFKDVAFAIGRFNNTSAVIDTFPEVLPVVENLRREYK